MDSINQKLLDTASSIRVLVVGDTMLDRYWLGDVDRISPEAPVPIINVNVVEECAGGAGNVAANIASLGARCDLLSFIGDDDAGKRLDAILAEAHVDRHLHIDAHGRTTEKLRIVSRNQQLLRVDFEKAPSNDLIRQGVEDFRSLNHEADVVVISDYGKGSLDHVEEMLAISLLTKKPIIIDPKGTDFSRYKGATVVTPNRSEFEAVTGVSTSGDAFRTSAFNLIEATGLEALLVTQGDEGMTLFRDSGEMIHQAASALEVFDVSGAGDTVVAVIALGLGLGLSWRENVQLATIGASAVVSRFGTSVVRVSDFSRVVDGSA